MKAKLWINIELLAIKKSFSWSEYQYKYKLMVTSQLTQKSINTLNKLFASAQKLNFV